MEWLKKILQGASVSDDGKLDVDNLTTQIAKEMPKHTVTKEVYNGIKEKFDAANARLSELESVDVEKLQNDLQAERDGRVQDRKQFALKTVLAKAGAKDVDYLLYKLGDTVEVDDSGTVKDEDGFIKKAKETYQNMFKEEETVIDGVKPVGGAASGGADIAEAFRQSLN